MRHDLTVIPRCAQSDAGVVTRSGAIDLPVVLDRRERVVEVVQQPLPLVILRRATESLGVIFQGVPLHQQEVGVRALEAADSVSRWKPGIAEMIVLAWEKATSKSSVWPGRTSRTACSRIMAFILTASHLSA